MGHEKNLLFTLIGVALLFIVSAISPQLSIFSDGNLDKTLYTNKISNVSINIEKNVTIISAVFNVTEVDLGVANYEQIYNFYTISVRNGTDELLAAGTRGYIALINRTNGSIIAVIDSGNTSYIKGSSFNSNGTEALLVTEDGKLLVYNAASRTITSKTASPYYLTGVAYSPNGTYAIGGGDWNGPLFYYNVSSGVASNLSNSCGGNCWAEVSVDINPNGAEALFAGYHSTYSKGITKYNLSCGLANLNTNNWETCGTLISSIQTTWRDVKYSPNGTEALIVGDKGKAVLYNASNSNVTNLTTGTNYSLRSVSYSSDGSKAIIVGLGGFVLVYNSSCNPNLCPVSSAEAVNLNSVKFINNTQAFIVGSGRTTLRYNSPNNEFTNLRNGTSGILYHVAARPNTDEALIVADDGQAYKYNFTTKAITAISSGVNVPLQSASFNWNGSEALAVGESGAVLKYNITSSTFTNLSSGVTENLLDISYRNGTNTALISGTNRILLAYNSSCDGITNPLCQITNLPSDFPAGFPILAVSFNPSGTMALLGAWGRMMKYNSSNGNISMVDRDNASGTNVAMWPHKIAWNPVTNDALIAGDSGGSDYGLGCPTGMVGAVALYNSTKGNITQTYCFGYNYLEDVAFNPNGTEALIVGRRGDLGKYNSSSGNLSNSITNLSSGTTGTLFGVDYRRDGIANEAILVVGDNKEILFYDGEKVMTNPEVFLGTARIWNFTGNYAGTTLINFTSNLTSYLSTCSADVNGICSVPFSVNATTQTSIMRFHGINITYNHAPILLSSIPSQSWNQDTATTINLTAYFNDSDRDILTYGNTAVTSITITINQTTGIVTLTPDSGFYGTRYIIFNATDSINLTNSNNITLTINQVISPPSGGTSGGGGGASTTCYPRWLCTSWGYCVNNTETRECIDANKCSSKAKPEETRNCTYEIMPEVQAGGIPAGAVLIEEKKSSSSMLKPVSCTKQDKSRISIIREFNVYEVKRGDSIEYKSVISLTIENTGGEEATNIEIKEIIPEIMLEEPSLTFSVEGITLKGNTLRYNIQRLNAKEKAYLNYSVNAKIDGSAISQTPRAVTGFSIIDTRFNPFTFISGIPSFIFKVVWSLLSIAFFLSLALTAIHWIKYGNLDTKAWKLGIILLLPIIMSIFDFALANYLIVLAVMPIAAVELFVFVRNRRDFSHARNLSK